MASEPQWDGRSTVHPKGRGNTRARTKPLGGGRGNYYVSLLHAGNPTSKKKLRRGPLNTKTIHAQASSCCSFVFSYARTRTHMAVTVGAHTHAHTHFVHREISHETWNIWKVFIIIIYLLLLFTVFSATEQLKSDDGDDDAVRTGVVLPRTDRSLVPLSLILLLLLLILFRAQ